MGNSEVGHLTIGSGRILYQDLVRVSGAVEDGSLLSNEALVGAFRRARERGGAVHLLGLVSTGGVHSHIDHLRALLELGRREGSRSRPGCTRSPTGATSPRRPSTIATLPAERIATVVGRYYAMDRQALGADDEGARRDRRGHGRAGRRPRGSGAGELRARRDGRVRRADRAPRAAALRPAQGHRDRLQLPPRPRPPADAAPARTPTSSMTATATTSRARSRSTSRRSRHPRGAEPRRPEAAARRRDGEVRPRDVLLQRRGGGAVAGEERILILPARRTELRPEAGDVRSRGRGTRRRGPRRRLRLLRRQLREPGHGRAHGVIPAVVQAVETVDGCLGRSSRRHIAPAASAS